MSQCARARMRLGLLALHNFQASCHSCHTAVIKLSQLQYELARELMERAAATEEEESGRGYPMAMWGAALATTQILWQARNAHREPSPLLDVLLVC